MSFGFGIGDVIAAINALVKACDKIAKVPKEILEASEDSKRLLTVISSIGKVTTEKTSIAHREPTIKEQLHLDIKEVTEDVGKLRNHLRIWKRHEKRPPLHCAAQRILFAFYNIPEIKEIRANFDEYRNRLSLMLNVLSIKSHNEARRGHDEIRRGQEEMLKIMKEIKASFANFEKKKESRMSLEENREKEREQKYLDWEKIGFGEKSSPGKVAELEDFFEQKLQENLVEDARKDHLDEITRRLWDAQTSDHLPRIKVSRHQSTESWPSSVSSSAHRERRTHHSAISREDSRPCSRDSRTHRTPLSRESTSSMTHSQSSTSSRSSHHRRRDSSQGSASTPKSLSQRLWVGVNLSLQGSSTTSSRRASVSNTNVQSSVGTPRPRAHTDLSLAIQELSLTEDEESEGWTTVPTHKRTHSTTHRERMSNLQPSTSNLQSSSRRAHPPSAQLNSLAPRSRQEVKILCVNWDNIAFSKLAQTYFELLRLWSINTNSHWLFDRVESAGICINTETDIDSRLAMDLLASPDFESGQFPNEQDRLRSRTEATRPALFDKRYLEDFKYVICFDRKSYDVVNQPRRSSAQTLLSGQLGLDHLAGKKLRDWEAEDAADKIKPVVESFMKKNLEWKRPDRRLAQGQRRTLQMVVSKDMTPHIIGKGGAKIKALEGETRCAIRIFGEGSKADRSLILATGKVEDLVRVEERINAMPLPQNYRREK